jgi:hypothetical protein
VADQARSVRALSEERFLGTLNGWSARNILARLIGCNRRVIKGSRQVQKAELPFYDVDPEQNHSHVNAALTSHDSSRDR